MLHLPEGTPPMEEIRPERLCPWVEPPQTYITRDKEIAKQEHDQIVQETKDNPRHFLAYTDGSKVNGEVGASVCIPQSGMEVTNYMGTN